MGMVELGGVCREIAAGEVNVAVQGMVEGVPLRTTLVPRGGGCHRLAIHGEIRKKLRVDAGAVVEVALERDEEPREPAVPPALGMALRREIVRFATGAKQEAARERRAQKVVRLLMERVERKKKRRRTSR